MTAKRDLHGILLLDKSQGLTSNDAVQRVKRCFQAKKVGHTGTLDPMATGMLVLCFGEATKYAQHLLNADKHYDFTMRLGQTTETGDIEGDITEERPIPEITDESWQEVVSTFLGPQKQIPPMYSALKHQGRPLYEWAREGKTLPRAARDIVIEELEILATTPETASFSVRSSKGTYIRRLAEDMGEHLGCGAHLIALRRLAVPPFKCQDMQTLEALEVMDESEQMHYLRPMEEALVGFPQVQITTAQQSYLRHGQTVPIFGPSPAIGWVQVFEKSRFLGLGQMQGNGRLAPKKLLPIPAENT
jgi:tRNA pseudouridine55 synthase